MWNASFVSRSRKTKWSTEIFFWNPKLSFWNVWKLTWLYFFVEKAADSPYTVHDRMVYVFIHQNTALVYCVKSLGYVFLWRYVIVFMLLLHKELFTVFEFNFSMIPDVLLSKCVLINCQIYKSEMYHVYELKFYVCMYLYFWWISIYQDFDGEQLETEGVTCSFPVTMF